ncbi:hypothetical protein [Halococcus thailandensis]|uniref:Uncharacterized protein n=1 Tax=Halococcus thailandensis JCM 13552 TaxID=1227457 RepID=M0N0N2_9EURY|nr:hypothetical protein [Halococcus thailandensis]EMA51517.1 hypothetical protein C451_14670 [Halococcus thailandensis JCM 13552]
MSRTAVKYAGVALFVGGLVLSTAGVGAFSTVEANRQLFVGVGGESSSYLDVSASGATVATNGSNDGMGANTARPHEGRTASTVVLGTVTNYFPAELDTIDSTVSKTSGGVTVSDVHVRDLPLGSGARTSLMATVDCGGVSSGTVTITFEATGTDTRATAERTMPVTCVNRTSSSPPNPSRPPSPQRAGGGSR